MVQIKLNVPPLILLEIIDLYFFLSFLYQILTAMKLSLSLGIISIFSLLIASGLGLQLKVKCPTGYSLSNDSKTCVDHDLCPVGTKLS